MKYIILLRYIYFLLLYFSSVKGGDLGDYSMYRDGRDSYGKVLPSGVYIFKLVTEWEQYSKKLLLLK